MGFFGDAWDYTKKAGEYGIPGYGQYRMYQDITKRPEGANPDNVQLPNYQQNRDQLTKYLQQPGRSPYVGQSGYQGDWRQLIGQMQQSASGQNSLAEAQYRRGMQDTQSGISSMARANVRPGAGRAAMAQMAQAGQGLAAGAAEARLAEQSAARQQLGGAIGAAGQQEWQRDSANQQAFMHLLSQQFGLDQAQLNAILQREAIKQQRAMQPSDLERYMGFVGQASEFGAKAYGSPA
jgi:hypothetical protein